MPHIPRDRPIGLGRVPPLDRELESVAADMLQGLQYSFVAAAAHPEIRLPFGGLEEAFQGLIGQRPPDQRWAYHSRARRIAMTPAEVRQSAFGRYAQFGAQEFAIGGLAIACRHLNAERIARRRWRRGRQAPPPDLRAAGTRRDTTLALYITEVTRLDRRASPPGGDDLAMGGLALDANGDVATIGRFPVGHDLDLRAGAAHGAPGRKFCEFHIRDALDAEQLTYGAAAFLEVGDGDGMGFAESLAGAWGTASPILREMVETGIPCALSTTVSRAAGWVLERFVRWRGDEFGDDVLPPGLAFAGVHPRGESSGASCRLTFAGRRGRYRVGGQWRMDEPRLEAV